MNNRKSPEHDLQVQCVAWTRYEYPMLRPLFYAVPNGGDRNEIVAARLKAEGVTRGVSDLILQLPSASYTQLCIEMKDRRGRQTPEQATYEACVKATGGQYVICRSFDEYVREFKSYIAQVNPELLSRLADMHRQLERQRVIEAYEEIKRTTQKPKVIKPNKQ